MLAASACEDKGYSALVKSVKGMDLRIRLFGVINSACGGWVERGGGAERFSSCQFCGERCVREMTNKNRPKIFRNCAGLLAHREGVSLKTSNTAKIV